MGASEFAVTAGGKDVDRAFDNAVRQAQYDYGHSGYTGSIAEKDSYVLVSEVPLDLDDARKLAGSLMDNEDPRIDDKWGPAGAIAIIGGGWLFFGWASE